MSIHHRLVALARSPFPTCGVFAKRGCTWRGVWLEYSTHSDAWLSGRASPSHGGGHRFKSCCVHQNSNGRPSGRPFTSTLRLPAARSLAPYLLALTARRPFGRMSGPFRALQQPSLTHHGRPATRKHSKREVVSCPRPLRGFEPAWQANARHGIICPSSNSCTS